MQTKFGSKGNCLTACIASLLELNINQVMDFHIGTPDGCSQTDPEGLIFFGITYTNG